MKTVKSPANTRKSLLNDTRLKLIYCDPVCQTGLEFNRALRQNAKCAKKQNSTAKKFMAENLMYFMNNDDLKQFEIH